MDNLLKPTQTFFMCAQYVQKTSVEKMAWHFNAVLPRHVVITKPVIFPKYTGSVVRVEEAKPQIAYMDWGLLPEFAKDRSGFKKYATFNARAESIETSPLYGPAYGKNQRCIIPMNAFYEWADRSGKKEKIKITRPGEELFGVAGLWSFSPQVDEGKGLHTYTMITTTPAKDIAPIHSRMPLALPKEDYDLWLMGEIDLEEAGKTARTLEFEVEPDHPAHPES